MNDVGAIVGRSLDANGRMDGFVLTHRPTMGVFVLGRVLTIMLVCFSLLLTRAASSSTVGAESRARGPLRVLRGDALYVQSLAFSKDGRLLVSGSRDNDVKAGQLKIWDVHTGKLLRRLPEPGTIMGVATSPDGKLIASASLNAVKLWEWETGRFVRQMVDHGTEAYVAVAFSPTGRLVAAEDTYFSPVRLWDVQSGQLRGTIIDDYGESAGLIFSPDGHTLVVSAGGGLDLWEVGTGRLVNRFDVDSLAAVSPAYSPDGTVLATVGWSRFYRSVVLLDARTGQEIVGPQTHRRDPHPNEAEPSILAYAPDGTLAISWVGLDESYITLWDVRRRTMVLKLQHDRPIPVLGSVESMAFSGDGKLLAAGVGGDVVLWDVADVLKH